jgi:hypothetical protein
MIASKCNAVPPMPKSRCATQSTTWPSAAAELYGVTVPADASSL